MYANLTFHDVAVGNKVQVPSGKELSAHRLFVATQHAVRNAQMTFHKKRTLGNFQIITKLREVINVIFALKTAYNWIPKI